MEVPNRLKNATDKMIDTLLKVKNQFWSIKKGEGFGRATHPESIEETFSQGILGPNANIILASLPALEESINYFSGCTTIEFHDLVSNMNRGWGRGKRMDGTFTTVAQAHEVPQMNREFPTPEAVTFEKRT